MTLFTLDFPLFFSLLQINLTFKTVEIILMSRSFNLKRGREPVVFHEEMEEVEEGRKTPSVTYEWTRVRDFHSGHGRKEDILYKGISDMGWSVQHGRPSVCCVSRMRTRGEYNMPQSNWGKTIHRPP